MGAPLDRPCKRMLRDNAEANTSDWTTRDSMHIWKAQADVLPSGRFMVHENRAARQYSDRTWNLDVCGSRTD
jgi:hypothetical protein